MKRLSLKRKRSIAGSYGAAVRFNHLQPAAVPLSVREIPYYAYSEQIRTMNLGRLYEYYAQCNGATIMSMDEFTKLFIISVLTEGLSYTKAACLYAKLGGTPPSKRDFYRLSPEVHRKIIELARRSCKSALEESASTTVSFDGSWSHWRNANHCFVSLIDTTPMVIDFQVVSKKNITKDADYEGPSNQMELYGTTYH